MSRKSRRYTPREPSNNVQLSIVNVIRRNGQKLVRIYTRRGKRETWHRVGSVMKCNAVRVFFRDKGREVSLRIEKEV